MLHELLRLRGVVALASIERDQAKRGMVSISGSPFWQPSSPCTFGTAWCVQCLFVHQATEKPCAMLPQKYPRNFPWIRFLKHWWWQISWQSQPHCWKKMPIKHAAPAPRREVVRGRVGVRGHEPGTEEADHQCGGHLVEVVE